MQTQAQIDRVVNEGGEGYSLAVDQRDVKVAREYYSEVERKNAEFAATWTLEVTQARRTAWNAEMQALISAGQQATARTIPPIVKRLGYSFEDIQRAKRMHAL